MNSEIKHTKKVPARRLFFAIWPDAALSRRLDELAGAVKKQAGGRVQKRENIHLTLRFIGAVDAETEQCLVEAAATIRAEKMQLNLDTLGFWPRPRVAWIAPGQPPAALAELAAKLEALCVACGIEAESRAFAPHITLLRKVRAVQRMPEFSPLIWPVDEFVLALSETLQEGVRYTVLQRWSLV